MSEPEPPSWFMRAVFDVIGFATIIVFTRDVLLTVIMGLFMFCVGWQWSNYAHGHGDVPTDGDVP